MNGLDVLAWVILVLLGSGLITMLVITFYQVWQDVLFCLLSLATFFGIIAAGVWAINRIFPK